MIRTAQIASAVRGAVIEAALSLRPDVLVALQSAIGRERSSRARSVLEQLVANARIAESDRVPLCQDTGTVWVRIELGTDECLDGDAQVAVDEAVRDAYASASLRMSVVRDALFDRANTNDNTPAFVDLTQRPGTGATVHVMLKGGGSDNASRVAMLAPADGWPGVREFVLETVRATAVNACPPVIVGVGVGSTFDKVGALAKRALLRPLDVAARDPRVAALEAELLDAIDSTGIGPAGLGGDTTALGVSIISAPCHIAALPVAVNMGCSAMRTVTVEVESE